MKRRGRKPDWAEVNSRIAYASPTIDLDNITGKF